MRVLLISLFSDIVKINNTSSRNLGWDVVEIPLRSTFLKFSKVAILFLYLSFLVYLLNNVKCYRKLTNTFK